MRATELEALRWTLESVAREEHKAKKLLRRCLEGFEAIRSSNLGRAHAAADEMIALIRKHYPED
jgi:hypothetical protein